MTGSSRPESWKVVGGSGSGGLAGIAGSGGFEAAGGRSVSYRLDYKLR